MIVFHKKDKRYYQVFVLFQICNKFNIADHYNMMVYIDDKLYPQQSKLYPISSKEVEITTNNLSEFYVDSDPEELTLWHKILDSFNYGKIIDGDREEQVKFTKWYQNENHFFGEIEDLNLSLENIQTKAIPIENFWVQCPECAEAFEVPTNRKFITCPKCQITMHNPYFERYDCL